MYLYMYIVMYNEISQKDQIRLIQHLILQDHRRSQEQPESMYTNQYVHIIGL
jgi:hypothetical protein